MSVADCAVAVVRRRSVANFLSIFKKRVASYLESVLENKTQAEMMIRVHVTDIYHPEIWIDVFGQASSAEASPHLTKCSLSGIQQDASEAWNIDQRRRDWKCELDQQYSILKEGEDSPFLYFEGIALPVPKGVTVIP